MLKPGLYEQIISQSLSRELASVSDACKHVEKLDTAEAPQAEILKYATELRSMTQGRGSYITSFERYEEVPSNLQDKIISEKKKEA